MAVRDLILIPGVARSGTSALTRVLSFSGCSLPDSLYGESTFNPKGAWEPMEVLRVHFEFMAKHDAPFPDPTLRLQEQDFPAAAAQELLAGIRRFLKTCPPSPVAIVKQPEIAEFMQIWQEAARLEGFSVKYVIPVRYPPEVFASMRSFGVETLELFNAHWIKRSLLAEHYSRAFPRVFVEYRNLLQDWRAEVGRIATALSIEARPDASSIDEFLTPELYRNRDPGAIGETFGKPWISQLYKIFSAAARDEPVDTAAVDEIYHEYRLNERAFRLAGQHYREYRSRFPDFDDHRTVKDCFSQVPVMKAGVDF